MPAMPAYVEAGELLVMSLAAIPPVGCWNHSTHADASYSPRPPFIRLSHSPIPRSTHSNSS